MLSLKLYFKNNKLGVVIVQFGMSTTWLKLEARCPRSRLRCETWERTPLILIDKSGRELPSLPCLARRDMGHPPS